MKRRKVQHPLSIQPTKKKKKTCYKYHHWHEKGERTFLEKENGGATWFCFPVARPDYLGLLRTVEPWLTMTLGRCLSSAGPYTPASLRAHVNTPMSYLSRDNLPWLWVDVSPLPGRTHQPVWGHMSWGSLRLPLCYHWPQAPVSLL